MSSEKIEPAFCHIIGMHYKRAQDAKDANDEIELEAACLSWWLSMQAINWITICIRNDGVDYIHASIAASNEMRNAANMIEHLMGYNPVREGERPGWRLKISNEDFSKAGN